LFSFTISPALQRAALRIAFEGSSVATVLMPARASSRKRQKQPHSWIAQCARAVVTLLVAVVMLPGMISDVEDHQSLPLSISVIPDADPEVFILARVNARWSADRFGRTLRPVGVDGGDKN
jgi:hypothetical protein